MTDTSPSPPRNERIETPRIETLLQNAMNAYTAKQAPAQQTLAMTMESQIHQLALAKARIFVRTKYGPRWFTERYKILSCTCAHDCVHKAMVDECALLEAQLDKWTQ